MIRPARLSSIGCRRAAYAGRLLAQHGICASFAPAACSSHEGRPARPIEARHHRAAAGTDWIGCCAASFSCSHSYQSSPSNSIGCWVRSEPLPHDSASTEQYRSHPQQLRSGCFGCSGNFFAMPGASQRRWRVSRRAMSDGASWAG
ncbi:hypothetical protein DO72_5907 [Burkholderia pseudomallei]|nr:hypothetical protein DO72_5907 [Burkholderia pseudomallei]